jgi:DNA-binding beta-propeller fold protein YncE
MPHSPRILLLLLLSAILLPAQTAPLSLSRAIELPGGSARFDHFAGDLAGNRRVAAATGNHSIEVLDLAAGKATQSIPGLGKPHGLAFADGALYVADGALAQLRRYKGSPLALAGSLPLSGDADDMVYDAARHQLFVGHGTGEAAAPARVAVVDTLRFALLADLPVPAHPEALEIDPDGRRVFVNIADTAEIVVIDAESRSIAATWKLTRAAGNVPLAYDPARRRLYLGCRKPPTLLTLDAATGNELSAVPAAAGADDLFLDPARNRVYVIGGAGEVSVHQLGPAAPAALGILKTAPGAKTGLFVPARNLLFVGIPGAAPAAASIRAYTPAP